MISFSSISAKTSALKISHSGVGCTNTEIKEFEKRLISLNKISILTPAAHQKAKRRGVTRSNKKNSYGQPLSYADRKFAEVPPTAFGVNPLTLI